MLFRSTVGNVAKSITPDMLDQSMVSAARMGDIRANAGLNALSDETKSSLVGKTFGSGVCSEGSTMSNIHFDPRGGFTADFTDGNGVTSSMAISPMPNARSIGSVTDADGNTYSITPVKAGNPNGTNAYTFDSKNPESVKQAEAAMGQSFKPLGNVRNSVSSVSRAENGDLIFNGANGGALARMNANGQVAFNSKPVSL